ncbi:DUF4367 domain-containing protein [Paenibacillus sp. 32O-W]|uniref:DUF4367 domain-containing protein n=1 Tax=Paenibacillus sp. 32O-W TaxID=1695218 RepID=UPI0011A9FA28|nr:DUF4367 domain-containing protein [Paenibacillus sp. 32O-W]
MRHVEENDQKIKEMLRCNHESVDIPDGSGSWLQVQVKLQKIKRRKVWLQRIRISIAVIACSLLISFFMSNNISISYAKFATLLQKIQGDIIQIFHEEPDEDSTHAKTIPPEEEPPTSNSPGSSFAPEKTSLEDAKNKIAFPLLIPSYIPERFTLDALFITKEANGTYNDAYFEYLNEDGELLKIGQRKIESKTGAIKTDINSDSGKLFDVLVGEQPAILFVDRNGSIVSLEWLTKDRIKVFISGPITKQDILQIGESLK